MYNIWSTYIGSLIKGRGTETGFKRLDMIMKLVTLRRVKTQQIEGKPIIDLPEKDERIQYIELSTRERAVYDKFKKIATDFYAKAVSSGDVV
jgi:SWI/SNF-related matrix-associated actin-dependent regulator of chromatin subfamily A3